MVARYIFSGSLPEDATTYVTRKADTQLYEGLKAGKFCYVLNSRQTGKSSLRVRTMLRLREEGFSCVAIDLSFGGIQYVTPEQWYVDLLDTLIDSLALDVDLEDWWEDHKLLSPLKRFRKLIEEVLLVEVRENIVIFIDEIDSVLSLNFPTDDFFAFIRACYNQRVDNSEYKRLSFCLLGVASPSELIADKKRTPFNIGQAIFLKGFELSEVEPLKKGLQGKINDSTAVIKEILDWTGGQPFLTQKLCQFVVEESEREPARSIEEIVRARIITNWESQDEPEHLKTIRDRILYRDEQRAEYLLELYQQIRQQGQTPLNDSIEQSELQLSGLVTKRQGKLFITNPIYREVFNQDWIDQQLGSLRPYSENFRAWIASGCKDESRFLRGQALISAEEWAKNKSLSYQDREFLAASRTKQTSEETAKREKEILTLAYQKAQRRISFGTVVLIATILAAIISFGLAVIAGKKALTAKQEAEKTEAEIEEIKVEIEDVNKLAKLSGELDQADKSRQASQAREHIGLFFEIREKIQDLKLKQALQALLSASSSLAHQRLGNNEKALEAYAESRELLDKNGNLYTSAEGVEVGVLVYYIQGQLFSEQKKPEEAIEVYIKAFQLLSKYNTYEPNIPPKILSEDNVESFHRELIELLSSHPHQEKLRSQAIESLKNHYKEKKDNYIKELKNNLAEKKWKEANGHTWRAIFYSAKTKNIDKAYFDWDNVSCSDLKKIDQLWVQFSLGRFGFSVQKRIYLKTGNKLGQYDYEAYISFHEEVGWREKEAYYRQWKIYEDLTFTDTAQEGHLPRGLWVYGWEDYGELGGMGGGRNMISFPRIAACKL